MPEELPSCESNPILEYTSFGLWFGLRRNANKLKDWKDTRYVFPAHAHNAHSFIYRYIYMPVYKYDGSVHRFACQPGCICVSLPLYFSLCVWVACPLCCKRSFIRKIFNLSSFSSSTQSQVKPNQTEPAVASASTRLACRFTSRQPVCSSSLLSSPALPLSLSVALSAPCMCANLSNIVPFPYAFHLSIFFCLYFSSARRLLLSCSCSSPAPPARALLFK